MFLNDDRKSAHIVFWEDYQRMRNANKTHKQYVWCNLFYLNCLINTWITFWVFPKLTGLKYVTGKWLGTHQREVQRFYYSQQWFSNCSKPKNQLNGSLKHTCLGPTPSISDLRDLRWSPRTDFASKSL